jgi:pimeloyl-ACP methyl ester carboxylesterase
MIIFLRLFFILSISTYMFFQKSETWRSFVLMNLGWNEEQKAYGWKVPVRYLMQGLPEIRDWAPNDSDRFERPTLFVGGERSDYILPEHHQNIYRFFPKATIQTVANAGHWVHVDNTPGFMDIIKPFLLN